MSMPISVMVSSVRGRSGGTGATIPSRGASVARPMPERSIASETKLRPGPRASTITSIRLGNADLELVDLHRTDILPIGLCTTVIGRSGMRTLKLVCAAALMIRKRTRSPGLNSPVQLSQRPVAVDQVRHRSSR